MATFSGSLFFSHIIPIVLGLFGILLIGNGIMSNEQKSTIIGVGMFLLGCFIPFLTLPFIVG